MSLIMVFPCAAGIVLATDSRSAAIGASGKIEQISDNSVKLLPVGTDMGILTHGIRRIGSDGISALSAKFPPGDDCKMDTVLGRATEIFLQTDRAWEADNPDFKRQRGDAGFLLAGFDTRKKYRIFGFSNPGYLPREISNPYAIEGKWPVARKLAGHLYNHRLSIDALCALALFLIRATAEGDPSVGGPAQLAILSPERGYISIGDGRRKKITLNSEKLFHSYMNTQPV